MKKTITKPDGSTEVVEGTPEEIAEYERKNGNVVKESKSKKKLLTDEVQRTESPGVLDVLELMRKFQELQPVKFVPVPVPYWMEDWCRIKRPPCNPQCIACNGGVWMGIVPPPCICYNGWCVQPQYQQVTYTVTSQNVPDLKVNEYQQSGGVLSVQTFANSTALGVA